MSPLKQLDAHLRPPEAMRRQFKRYQKCKAEDLHDHPDVIDTNRVTDEDVPQLLHAPEYCFRDPDRAFQDFLTRPFDEPGKDRPAIIPAFEINRIPG
jgi:hypothetical protein